MCLRAIPPQKFFEITTTMMHTHTSRNNIIYMASNNLFFIPLPGAHNVQPPLARVWKPDRPALTPASLPCRRTYLQELLNFYEGRKPILPESKYHQQHQQQVQHQQQTQQQDPSGGVCSAGGGTCSSTAPITLSHDHEQSSSRPTYT